MSDVILIDGNSLGFAAHAAPKLTVGDQQTQAVFGMVRTMRAMRSQYPRSVMVALWDGGENWRKTVYPEYKANRETNPAMKKMRDDYRSQRPIIYRALRALGIDQITSPQAEADDLAGAFSQHFTKKRGMTVRLITGDKDWLQLINDKCAWHDPIRNDLVTLANFEEFTGGLKRPRQIIDMKALMGDTSDNVKGCGGIGEVGAMKLLKAFGSVDRFLQMYEKGQITECPKPWVKLALNEDGRLDRYKLNVTLMSLLGAAKPGVDKRELTPGVLDPETFQTLADELAFHSITANLDSWLAPFKRTGT